MRRSAAWKRLTTARSGSSTSLVTSERCTGATSSTAHSASPSKGGKLSTAAAAGTASNTPKNAHHSALPSVAISELEPNVETVVVPDEDTGVGAPVATNAHACAPHAAGGEVGTMMQNPLRVSATPDRCALRYSNHAICFSTALFFYCFSTGTQPQLS